MDEVKPLIRWSYKNRSESTGHEVLKFSNKFFDLIGFINYVEKERRKVV